MTTTRPSRRFWITAFALFAGGVGRFHLNTEAHVLRSCIRFPNFAFSLLMYVLTCGAFLAALKGMTTHGKSPRWPPLCAGLAGFALAWVHPFDVPPLGAIGAAALIWRWRQTHRAPRALLAAWLSFCVAAALPILYLLYLKLTVPVFAAIDAQNVLRWGHWWSGFEMLEAYLVVALVGLAFLWRHRRRPETMFVIVWIVVGLAMQALPFQFQRRMIEGLPIALAFAASGAVEALLHRFLLKGPKRPSGLRRRARLARHWAYLAVWLMLFPKTYWVLYDHSVGAFGGTPQDGHYAPASEVAGYDWLRANTDWREVVWGAFGAGNVIPFLTGNRVFMGHNIETLEAARKGTWTARLFTCRLSPEELGRIIDQYGVDYIYESSRVRFHFKSHGVVEDYYREVLGPPVYRNEEVKIYRVACGRRGPDESP